MDSKAKVPSVARGMISTTKRRIVHQTRERQQVVTNHASRGVSVGAYQSGRIKMRTDKGKACRHEGGRGNCAAQAMHPVPGKERMRSHDGLHGRKICKPGSLSAARRSSAVCRKVGEATTKDNLAR